jgi:hypothetical protein
VQTKEACNQDDNYYYADDVENVHCVFRSSMGVFSMKARRLNRKRLDRRYVPSFTEATYLVIARHRSTVAHSSSFAGARAAKDGQQTRISYWVVLLPRVVRHEQLEIAILPSYISSVDLDPFGSPCS